MTWETGAGDINPVFAQLQPEEGLSSKLCREAYVIGAGLARAVEAKAEHPGELGLELLGSATLGAGLVFLQRGAGLRRLAGQVLGLSLGTSFVLDIASPGRWNSLGSALSDTWSSNGNLDQQVDKVGTSLGNFVADTIAMTAGGMAGVSLGKRWFAHRIADLNLAAARDNTLVPTAARQAEHSEHFHTARENGQKADWAKLYEKSFPVEERQPLADVLKLLDKGVIRLDVTRNPASEVEAFSLVSMHENGRFPFANLDFIATNPLMRSKGIGSLHLSRLNQVLQTERPDLAALTLEIESRIEPGIDATVRAQREYRAKFYDRLGATQPLKDLPIAAGKARPEYFMMDFNTKELLPGEFYAFVYKRDKFDVKEAIRALYTSEAGYGLDLKDPADASVLTKIMRQFD